MEKDAKQAEALLLLTKYFDEINTLSERETDLIMSRLSEISPDPAISDYIFYPEGPELSAKEIVDKAFSYKSIIL